MRDDFTPEVNDEAEKILVERPENLEPEIEALVGMRFFRCISISSENSNGTYRLNL